LVRLFSPTPAKRFVRNAVDLPAIKQQYSRHEKPLTYFGLPSEGLYDILDWRKYIGKIVAVEKGDSYAPERKQAILLSKAIQLGLHTKLTLLRGELNQIILKGQDVIGQKLEYPFELVNFDYGGALLYPDRSRVKALEKFVSEQRGTDFLFLMTLNAREYDPAETNASQQRISAEICQISSRRAQRIENYFQTINAANSPSRQITHVLYLLKGLGEANHYRISWEPPVLYRGSKNTELIHYRVTFSYEATASTKVVSDQSLVDILGVRPLIAKGKTLTELALPIA